MGYMEVIKAIPGLTHYYPLNSTFQLQDQVGTAHGTNGAGAAAVTFGSTTVNSTTVDAARFQGAQYFNLPDHNDFSILDTSPNPDRYSLHIHMHVIFDNFAGGSGNNTEHYHWMGKGATGSTPVEWELRRYRSGGSGQAPDRPLRMSNYAFPSAGGSGAGDYIQPSPDGSDGGLWSNMTLAEQVAMRTPGYEVVYGAFFTFDPTTGAGAGGPYPGYCQASFRDRFHILGSSGAAHMNAYSVAPHDGTQVVRVGTSDDGRGYLIGRIRRLAFFNRKLTTTELATLANAQSQEETSVVAPGNPGIDTHVEAFTSIDLTKYDVTNGSNATTTGGALRLTAGTSGPIVQTKSARPYAITTTGIYLGDIPAGGAAGTATYFALVNNADTNASAGFKMTMQSNGACLLQAGIMSGTTFSSEITQRNYSTTTHRYLKIAQASSTTLGFYSSTRLPTSPSDNPWVSMGTVTLPAWAGAARIKFAQTSPSAQTTFSQFANVNGAVGTLSIIEPVLPPPVVTPGVDPIIDDFDEGIDTARWNANVGTPTVNSSTLILDATATAEVLSTTTKVNLTGKREFIEVTEVPSTTASFGRFRMMVDTNNALQWRFSGGFAQAQQVVNGVTTNIGGTVAFNAAQTKLFSIREASGRVYFEFGPTVASMTAVEPAGRVTPITQVTSLTTVIEAQTP